MCYSAIVKANYREFCRMFGATLSIREFVELYVERSTDSSVIMPKAMSDSFLDSPDSPEEQQIVELISAFNALRRTAEEEELFKQMTRLTRRRPRSRSNRRRRLARTSASPPSSSRRRRPAWTISGAPRPSRATTGSSPTGMHPC